MFSYLITLDLAAITAGIGLNIRRFPIMSELELLLACALGGGIVVGLLLAAILSRCCTRIASPSPSVSLPESVFVSRAGSANHLKKKCRLKENADSMKELKICLHCFNERAKGQKSL